MLHKQKIYNNNSYFCLQIHRICMQYAWKFHKLSFLHHTFVTTVDSRGTLQENAHLKDRNTLATIAEAKGTLPETVLSEQSRLIIAMNIEKYVQVIWVSPLSGL